MPSGRLWILATCACALTACSSPEQSGTPDATADVHIQINDAAADAFDALDAPADVTFDRAPLPHVPLTANKVMSSPTLVTIVASNDDLPAALTQFSEAVPSSQFWSSISAEYALGAITAGPTLVVPTMSGTYSNAELATIVQSAIASQDAGYAPNGNTIYLVYLPSSALFSGTFANDCGYHASYPTTGSLGDQMAIVRRCAPAADQETQLGELTRVAAHEIAESATDPLGHGYNLGLTPATPWTESPWQAWVGAGLVELGDLCEGTRRFEIVDGGPEGGFEYQRIWSNASAADGGDPCEPPASDPYESVATSAGWYTATAGEAVSIPIIGWSIAPAQPWVLYAFVDNGTAPFDSMQPADFSLKTSDGVGTSGTCYVREGMSTNALGTLNFTMPTSVASGDWVVIEIDSFREKPAPSCYPPITEDDFHFWVVGVHVP